MSVAALGATRGKLAGWLVFIVVLITIAYASRHLVDAPDTETSDFVYRWSAVVAGLFQFAIMGAVVLWISARGPARDLLALRPPRSWRRAAWLALAVLVGTLVFAGLLEPLLGAGEEQGLTPEGWDPSRAPQFFASFVLIAGFVPVVEELVFRGLGYSLIEPRAGALAAMLVTGLLFGLAHGLLRGLPILVAFGVALAWLRSHTDSVLPAIATHSLFNAFALIASVTVDPN